MRRRPRRSRAEIVYDILHALATRGPQPPTRLSYAVRLPYDRFAELLEWMVEKGYVSVREEDGRRLVFITRRGWDAMKDLEAALTILKKLGLA